MIPQHADQPTNAAYNAGEPRDLRAGAQPTERVPVAAGLERPRRSGPARRRAEVHLRHGGHLRHALARRTSTTPTASATPLAEAANRPHQRPGRRTSTPSSADRRSPCGRPSRSRPATSSPTAARTATSTCSPRTPATPSSGSTRTPRTPTRARCRPPTGRTRGPAQQGQEPQVAADRRQGGQDGRLPAVLDVRQVLQEDRRLHVADHLPRRHRQGQRRTTCSSWYYAWGGASDTSAGWAWRIGSATAHFGYQNPIAAYALSNDAVR